MRAAQRLYEQGWITYMRTDSTTLSDEAIRAARSTAASMFGDDYVADAPRRYDRKVKNAQEAHEAIRPAGESFRTLDEAQSQLGGDELAVYDLMWKRTLASQMVDARLTQDKVRSGDHVARRRRLSTATCAVGLSATGLRIEFPGLSPGLRRGDRRPRGRAGRPGAHLAAAHRGRGRAGHERRGQGTRHAAAGPLLRGDVDQEARGPRHRTTLDLRVGDEDDRSTRLRVEEGQVPGAGLSRLRRRQPPPALLRRPRRLPVHGRHGGRTRRDRPGQSGPRAVAAQVLLRRSRRRRPSWPSSASNT